MMIMMEVGNMYTCGGRIGVCVNNDDGDDFEDSAMLDDERWRLCVAALVPVVGVSARGVEPLHSLLASRQEKHAHASFLNLRSLEPEVDALDKKEKTLPF